MDATTLAALSVALEQSRAAANQELLLERERLAMAVQDRDSFLAQRYFVSSMQVPRVPGPMTWAAAYEVRHENFLHAQDAMRDVWVANRQGDAERIEDILADELGSTEEEEDEEEAEALVCVLCQRLSRDVYQTAPLGRWEGLAPDERLVCGACYRLQPPQ